MTLKLLNINVDRPAGGVPVMVVTRKGLREFVPMSNTSSEPVGPTRISDLASGVTSMCPWKTLALRATAGTMVAVPLTRLKIARSPLFASLA